MAAVKPLLVIVGPTASGKTQLALDIAERYDGEIIAADSRTIYRGLDIGTAKPTADEQQRVPHHVINIVDPDETFSAYQFQQLATQEITDIRSRNKLPIMVGGTGLYIDSVIFDYTMNSESTDLALRAELEELSVEELQAMIIENNFTMPENRLNKRHLIRTIERKGASFSRRDEPIGNTLIVGITTEKQKLNEKIGERVHQMFDQGVEAEANSAAAKYGWDAPGLSGNIYQIIRQIEAGELSQEQAIERCIILDRQLAKRQMTWLRRNRFINWLELRDAEHFIQQSLS